MAVVYLDNSEMKLFYDLRRLKDLLTDDGSGDDLTENDINNEDDGAGELLFSAIEWASSEIDAKCQNGLRYTRANLEEMIADATAGTDAQRKRAATLKKLTADLAFGFLAQRRAQSADQLRELAPAYDEALERLEQLYDGKKVFDLDSALLATVPTRRRLGKLANLSRDMNQMFGIFPDRNGLFPDA